MPNLRLIGAADADRLVDMRAAIDAMARAFEQIAQGRAVVPKRLGLDTPNGIVLSMPGFLADDRALAIKVVTVFPHNGERGLPSIYGTVLVLDGDTGAPRALIEGGRLTALRTGAVSGLATQLMSRDDSHVVVLFGAGVQARTQLAGVRAVRDIREVRLVSRSRERVERFAAELKGVDVRVLDDSRAAVRGADIIITATTSSEALVHGEDVDAGTHITAIGAYTPAMREVDAHAVRSAKLIVDTKEGAMAEAGDILRAISERAIDANHILGELGDVVTGRVTTRGSRDDITMFKSVGNAAQDVALAHAVLAAAEAQDAGTVAAL